MKAILFSLLVACSIVSCIGPDDCTQNFIELVPNAKSYRMIDTSGSIIYYQPDSDQYYRCYYAVNLAPTIHKDTSIAIE